MSKRKRQRKKLRPRIRRRTAPGASPGTIHVAADAPRSVITAYAFDAHELEERTVQNPAELRHLLARWPVTWVNIDGLGNADLLQQVSTIFDIHPLALEDVVNVHQRSKVERYPRNVYLVIRMPDRRGRHVTEQLSLFLGENYVVTFQERAGEAMKQAEGLLDKARDNVQRLFKR